MADGEGTLLKDNSPPTDPKEGSSKSTEQKKEQSLSHQDTEGIIDGLFRRLKESDAIPVNQEAIKTPSNSGQLIFYHDRFPLKALTILAIAARHCTDVCLCQCQSTHVLPLMPVLM